MSDRIKNAFDDLLHNMEEAPSWDQVTSARVSDTPRFNRGLAFAGGVAGVMALGIVASMVFSGPGDVTGDSSATGAPYIEERGGTILLVARQTDTGEDALISGRLTIGVGGCLSIETDSTAYTAVWPWGSTLSADGRSISIPGSETLEVGSLLHAGGGYLTSPTSDPRVPEIPDACAGSTLAIIAPQSVRPDQTTTPPTTNTTAMPGNGWPDVVTSGLLRLLVGSWDGGPGHMALITGVLDTNEQGCIGIRAGEDFRVVVWPGGTRFGDANEVVVPGSGTFRLGDQIRAGGGYFPVSGDAFTNCGLPSGSDVAVIESEVRTGD